MGEDVAFQLGGIRAQLETVLKTQAEDRMASAQYRTDIRKELREAHEDIGSVKSDLAMAKADIAEMKPKVITLEQRALMSAGAAKLAIVLGKFAHIISAAVGGAIVIILDKLVFHK